MSVRVMTREEANTAMRLAGEVHQGRRKMPPEIIAKRHRIRVATKNAEDVMDMFRQVDMSLVNDIVRMRLELDTLYSEWTRSETVYPT